MPRRREMSHAGLSDQHEAFAHERWRGSRAIHWSESFPSRSAEIADTRKKQSADLRHLIHRKMTTANQIKRQPCHQEIQDVVDGRTARGTCPKPTAAAECRESRRCFRDGAALRFGAASSLSTGSATAVLPGPAPGRTAASRSAPPRSPRRAYRWLDPSQGRAMMAAFAKPRRPSVKWVPRILQ